MDSQTRRVKAHDRTLQALELRKAGCTYAQIADTLHYGGPQGAHKAVTRALKATLKEPAEAVRTLELERLDVMLFALWPRVRAGDIKAITPALRVMERRARLLGLDCPQSPDTYAEGKAAIVELVERLRREHGRGE